MFEIPEKFRRNRIAMSGEEAIVWLDRLPGVLANLLNQGVAFDLFDQGVRLGRPHLFE